MKTPLAELCSFRVPFFCKGKIDKGKEQRYYCKSAFEKTTVDYLENQAILTMLKKEKIVDGSVTLLFQHPNYIERSEA